MGQRSNRRKSPTKTLHIDPSAEASMDTVTHRSRCRFHSGGDESLFGWPWSEILSALRRGSPPTGAVNGDESKRGDGVKSSPPLRVRCPQARTRRGAFSPYPEINDIVFDKVRKFLPLFLDSLPLDFGTAGTQLMEWAIRRTPPVCVWTFFFFFFFLSSHL